MPLRYPPSVTTPPQALVTSRLDWLLKLPSNRPLCLRLAHLQPSLHRVGRNDLSKMQTDRVTPLSTAPHQGSRAPARPPLPTPTLHSSHDEVLSAPLTRHALPVTDQRSPCASAGMFRCPPPHSCSPLQVPAFSTRFPLTPQVWGKCPQEDQRE